MFLKILLAIFGCTVCSASDVIEFTDDNFTKKIKDYEIILVEFFTPWCGHCKKLAPEYELAATKLKKNDPPIPLAKVDCSTSKTTCESQGAAGYPTLKVYRKGQSTPYDGPREADGIVKLMRSQVGPSSRELKTFHDYENFITNEEPSVIGFFEKDTKLKDSFLKVADTERDRYRFGHVISKDMCTEYEIFDDIIIVQPKQLQNKFEDAQIKYDGNYDTERIKKFLDTRMNGLCSVRTPDNAYSFTRPLVIAYYKVDYTKDPKGTNYWRNRILKVAKEYKRKVRFAVAHRDDFYSEIQQYGLGDEPNDKPIVAAQGAHGEKYKMEEEFSVENLQNFVDDLLADKLTNYVKSEPIPENNDKPVKILVGKNFKNVVEGKDALIEFYAPWCGHCKAMEPTFEELGRKLKDEDVVIAKMDGTANDVPPGYNVNGFPTIYWKPKNGQPVMYPGGRELNDFFTFIAEFSTNELKEWSRDGKKKSKKSEL